MKGRAAVKFPDGGEWTSRRLVGDAPVTLEAAAEVGTSRKGSRQ
jgi:hypothetical protein